VANSILWLASTDANFVTGEILTIDGGQSLTTNNYSDYLKELDEQRAGDGMVGYIFGAAK